MPVLKPSSLSEGQTQSRSSKEECGFAHDTHTRAKKAEHCRRAHPPFRGQHHLQIQTLFLAEIVSSSVQFPLFIWCSYRQALHYYAGLSNKYGQSKRRHLFTGLLILPTHLKSHFSSHVLMKSNGEFFQKQFLPFFFVFVSLTQH